jgi:mannitol-1-/sugar-/sorbitol-6-phosphatase
VTNISCCGILFDLDGVLIDSTPAVARVWTKWAIEHGFDPEDTVRRAHGRPSLDTIRELLPNGDHEAENLILESREIEDLEGVVAAPGARALVNTLPSGAWTIVTSCTRPLAEARIQAAGLPVPEKIITSTDITHGKPHPEPFLKGAALLGFAPSDCVVFEDAPAGVRSGKGAAARVIALLTTFPHKDLNEAGADWIVKNCSAVTLDSTSAGSPTLKLTLS